MDPYGIHIRGEFAHVEPMMFYYLILPSSRPKIESIAESVATKPIFGALSMIIRDWIPLIDEYYYCRCCFIFLSLSLPDRMLRYGALKLFVRHVCTLNGDRVGDPIANLAQTSSPGYTWYRHTHSHIAPHDIPMLNKWIRTSVSEFNPNYDMPSKTVPVCQRVYSPS